MRTRWIIGGALLLACAAFARQSNAALPPATTMICQQRHSDDEDEWIAIEQVIAAQEQDKRAVETAQKKVKEALAQTRDALRATTGALALDDHGLQISLMGLPDTRVNLDLKDAPVREALKQLFEQAKQEYELEKDVPEDVRITLQVKNVKFGTALNLITEAAGIRWGREIKDGKSVFRLGKSVRPGISAIYNKPVTVDVDNMFSRLRDISPEPLMYSFSLSEERASFTCPHCKGQVTTVRQRVQPKCPRCDRTFRSDWQFCPYDGSKRPPTPGAWKFCPLCGKPVDLEKPEEKKER